MGGMVLMQAPSLGLGVEEFAKAASGYSGYKGGNGGNYKAYASGYQPFIEGGGDAFEKHLASVGQEPVHQPDYYWSQIVQIAHRELKGAELLEKNDKKHRMGDLLEACFDLYKNKKAGGKTFFDWLDGIPEWERIVMIRDSIAVFSRTTKARQGMSLDQLNIRPSIVTAFLYGVRYLDKAGRKQYRLTFPGGQAIYNGGPFDTSNMRTVFSGRGSAIWVQSPKDHFYAGNHVLGHFHHSSFLSGGAVKCGGEVQASQGVLTRISAKSGHYQPTRDHFANAIRTLGALGVNMNKLMVVVWLDVNSPASVISAAEFLHNPKRWETWGNGPIPKS